MTGIVSSLRELADKIESLGPEHPISKSDMRLTIYSWKLSPDDQVKTLKDVRNYFQGGKDEPMGYNYNYCVEWGAATITFSFVTKDVCETSEVETVVKKTIARPKA